jgi:hypothetical protein
MDDAAADTVVLDSSGNGYHGTLSRNTNLVSEAGVVGNCFHFNGSSDFVTVPYSAGLVLEKMTVALWVNTDNLNYTGNVYLIAMYEYATSDRMWGFYIDSSENFRFAVSADGGTTIDSTNAVKHDEAGRHHIAFTWDNSTGDYELFYDGVSVQTDTLTKLYTNQGSDLTIGALPGSNFFDGLLDDVRIYNEILPIYRVKDLFNSGRGTGRYDPSRKTIGGVQSRIRRSA